MEVQKNLRRWCQVCSEASALTAENARRSGLEVGRHRVHGRPLDADLQEAHKKTWSAKNFPSLAALAIIAGLVPVNRCWAIQLTLVLIILTLPGIILLRALRVPGAAIIKFPIYIACGSVSVLFASGLACDLIGPLLGVHAPIRTVPVLISLELTCLILLAASMRAPDSAYIPWKRLLGPARLYAPLIIPAIGAVGALELNSGHGNFVAALAIGIVVLAVVSAAILGRRLDERLLGCLLYASQLSVMWSYSLRGNLVYGFDVATEYYDLTRTIATGVWQTSHIGDAYGAMLSVTVMPAEIHFLSGIPALYVLKVVYPAICALIPVAIFRIGRHVLRRRWAFIAAALFVVQAGFSEELVALARQEIAIVLFVGLVAAVIDASLSKVHYWTFVAVLSGSVVVAHYSTSYVMITLLAASIALQWLVSWIRPMRHVTGSVIVAFLASVIVALIWYGPVTHSAAAGLHGLAAALDNQGLNVLPNRSQGTLSALGTYLQGNTETPMAASQYQHLVHVEYALHKTYITPLPNAGLQQFDLRNVVVAVPPAKVPVLNAAFNLIGVVIEQLIYILATVGALLMTLRRGTSAERRMLGLMSVAAMIFLGLLRVSGTLAQFYNQERALMQAMIIIGVAACWPLQWLSDRGHLRGRAAGLVAAVSLAILLVANSGLVGGLVGGGTTTNLADSGEDYQRFDMTSAEIGAAQWLGKEAKGGTPIYADRYAQLPLTAMTGVNHHVVSDVTPLTINSSAWIYASQPNVLSETARALFDNHTVLYIFPYKFINADFDLVYSDGASEVFFR